MKHQLLKRLKRPEPELLANLTDGVISLGKMEIHVGNVLADDLDLRNPANAQPSLMGRPDATDIHRVKSHQCGRYRVYSH